MKMSVLWIENSDGKKDVMLTFAFAAFAIVLLKVLFGGVTLEIGDNTYKFLEIDSATVAALLTPTFGAYVARRYTDRKFLDANNNGIDDREEEG